MVMRKSSHRGSRPKVCDICSTPLPQATRGRPRLTCSDRRRQIKRRRDYTTWIDPREWQKTMRRAEREVRKIEKALGGPGSLDIPTPGYEWLTLRKRVLIRLQRGEGVPFCKVCGRPYINDTPRRVPTCRGWCEAVYRNRQKALEKGLKKFAGRYDPRVDVRLRLGLAIKTCQHCGKPFPDYHPRRVYCSRQCCRNASYARNPKRTCPECGTRYRGKRAVCSTRCYNQRYFRKTGLFCTRCRHAIKLGSEILPDADTRLPRIRKSAKRVERPIVFCSGRCRDTLGWSPKYKFCEGCREMYYPKAPEAQESQKFCSKECGQATYNARRRAQYERLPIEPCRQCGGTVPLVPTGGVRWYCGEACRRIAYNARRRDRRKEAILVRLPERVLEMATLAPG